ncbi:YncE family protein [Kitasatospora cineracea]|uniref:DNA-binding beta-propeller fold protein YncE n=1 Tax=Kitasatospora cineracea TaxID=88074 RepID=A0A8G1UD91_9ACTN|nr:YncE family protein [Kitasatospora cineracea]ROR37751.1 DNA-binding beta-propeller fold protein YncE [Kitasatospora cineracea]
MANETRAARAGDVLAVVSQGGGTVSFFDAASDGLLGDVEVPSEPHELCFDAERRLLWCSTAYRSGYYHANSGRASELTAIDPDTRRVVAVVDLAPEHGPHGLALDAARGLLYVSVEGGPDRTGGVVVVDAASRKAVGRIDTGAPGPHWFAVDPAGRRGYATNKEAPFVSVVDLERGVMTGRVEVPGSEGLAVSADGAAVYAAGPYLGFAAGPEPRPANGVRVIDTATGTVVRVLATESPVLPVHLTARGALLVGEVRTEGALGSGLGRQLPGRLTVFDPLTGERRASLETGRFPLTLASSPDGRLGYLAAVESSTVDVVDLETFELLARLDVPKRGEPGAHGLAYVPRPA